MKKKLLVCLPLALLLVLSLALTAFAEARLDYVNDYANLISAEERRSLNETARLLSDQYDCGVYIVAVEDYTQYVNGSIEKFAEEVFHSYGLGYGSSVNGVLLAISMKSREYDIYAHGDFGNYAFTDYGKKQLAQAFLDNFSRSDWAGGFRDFVNKSGEFMAQAKAGKPVDTFIPDQVERKPGFSLVKFLIALSSGCLVGGVTVGGMKRPMKTAVVKTSASDYVARGGVNLKVSRDDFIHRSVTRTPIPRQQPGMNRPGGGHYGGTTISGSHGGSHSSGKF